MTEAAEKKDVQKLQRSIVDSLEDVKAQDIVVFNTEHLSSLFERVVIASGTSNRQTKALAASVRDGVRDAGFAKPRMEGEDNGEWIIVDCGSVVVHIMQPAIRTYYHLEEIWGEKPVRIKLGAPKPIIEKPPATVKTVSAKPVAKKTSAVKKTSAASKTPAAKKTPAATKTPAVKKRPTAPRKK
jgi:ribosome-associated protein